MAACIGVFPAISWSLTRAMWGWYGTVALSCTCSVASFLSSWLVSNIHLSLLVFSHGFIFTAQILNRSVKGAHGMI